MLYNYDVLVLDCPKQVDESFATMDAKYCQPLLA